MVGTPSKSAWTTVFPVPANAEVVLKVKSPNAADSDVDVTAYLFDVSPIVPGVVPGAVNDVGADSDDFDTNLTEATNDHYNGCVIVFTNGVLAGQSRRILDYDGTAKNIIVESAFTEAPGNGDKFMILGRIEV